MSKTVEAVRIDKWLWAARFFKTRTLASDAVDNGKVRLNDERTKPAHNLKVGDILAIDNGASVWEVAHDWRRLWCLALAYFALAVISALAVKRGPGHAAD